jgi:hypothetical protein
MNEFSKAMKELKACILLQPNDKKLRQDLENLQKEEAKHNQTLS